MRILAVGDNCIDDYVELGKRFPGGNALNVAVYASRHPDVDADYVGIVGTDDSGEYLVAQIEEQGLDTGKLITREGVTAVTKILIRDGDRVFAEYIEGVQKDATLPYDRIPDPNSHDAIHFTGWGCGREHVKRLKEETSALLSCDFSSNLDDPRTGIMPSLDISFFSGSHLIEKNIDPEQALMRLKEKTQGIVVMTLGEHGSLVYDGETIYRGEASPVEVMDTLGAGDAYIAEFLYKRINGKSIQEAIEAGHIAASEICKRLGAWGGD